MQTRENDIILFIASITAMLIFLLCFIAAILFFYHKKFIHYYQHLESVKNLHEKNILQTKLEIQEQTLLDISREIHDNIGLSLTLAKLQLNTMQYTSNAAIGNSVHSSAELIGKAISDLGDVSKGLNSEAIKSNGLYNTLKTEIEKINRSGNYKAEFTGEGPVVFLTADRELILYRIAQEALNNVLKHAGASSILLSLKYETRQVILSVQDNGTGFDASEIEKKSIDKMRCGLRNIRFRTLSLKGSFAIKSGAGNGTIVSVTIPY